MNEPQGDEVAPGSASPRVIRIFVSHSRRDAEWVQKVQDVAAKRFADLELDSIPYNENAGDTGWRARFHELIEAVDGLVCRIERAAAPSSNVTWELEEATRRGVPVLLVGAHAKQWARQYKDGVWALATSDPAVVLRELRELTSLERELFPTGRPDGAQGDMILEQFKLMLQTTEALESRRQTLHTFFMSINTLLLAAVGFIGKESLDDPGVGWGVIVLGIVGLGMSLAWRQQIVSHGGVLRSKWKVLNHIEQALPVRPFAAEWGALRRSDYRSFTEIECSVPLGFAWLYGLSIVVGAALVLKIV